MQFTLTLNTDELEGPKQIALGVLLGLLPTNEDGTVPTRPEQPEPAPEPKPKARRRTKAAEPTKTEPEPTKTEKEPEPEPEPEQTESEDDLLGTDDKPMTEDQSAQIVKSVTEMVQQGHHARVRAALDKIGVAKAREIKTHAQAESFLTELNG